MGSQFWLLMRKVHEQRELIARQDRLQRELDTLPAQIERLQREIDAMKKDHSTLDAMEKK